MGEFMQTSPAAICFIIKKRKAYFGRLIKEADGI
jgi:hypothetical protein